MATKSKGPKSSSSTRKKSASNDQLKPLDIWKIGGSWLFFTIWLALLPAGSGVLKGEERTAKKIEALKQNVESFALRFGRVPNNWEEIRLWGKLSHSPVSPYDAFGNRLEYVPLTSENYLIRSFGRDQRTNTLSTPPDIILSKVPGGTINGVQTNTESPDPKLYPFPASMGAISPNLETMAAIYVNAQETGTKQLLVRKPESGFTALAPSTNVEEFLWDPSSTAIVYTSRDYESGGTQIFYWNLLANETKAISEGGEYLARVTGRASPTIPRWISLAGFDSKGRLLTFEREMTASGELDPADFYTYQNLFHYSGPNFSNREPSTETGAPFDSGTWSQQFQSSIRVISKDMLFPQQDQWLSLAHSGDMGKVISSWQDYTQGIRQNPLFPYVLWYLTVLYADAATDQSPWTEGEKPVLRAYGIEVAEGLKNLGWAPGYLRAFARFHAKKLANAEGVNYSVFDWQKKNESEGSISAEPPPTEPSDGEKSMGQEDHNP